MNVIDIPFYSFHSGKNTKNSLFPLQNKLLEQKDWHRFVYVNFFLYLCTQNVCKDTKIVRKETGMDTSIIPLKISELAKLVSRNKHIPISSALSYIYDSPFYEQLYEENAKWWYLDTESLYQELERAREQSLVMVHNNVTTFLTFCIERYAQKHKITSLQAYALFRRYKVDHYLINGFDVLHTQGVDTILHDIEIFLQNHSKK